MTTALITHPDCLEHVPPGDHPERPARLEAVLAALAVPEFDSLARFEAPIGSDEDLLLVHPAEYVKAIRAAAPSEGLVKLDADTWMSPGSLRAALRCVGGNVKAVDLVVSGEVGRAFCAMRPPGHHAEKARAMGFCLFGSVAVAARHALENSQVERVAIVDFDVHHGNGTQDLLWHDDRVLFCSTHQMPLYPGTGYASETGAHGNVLNLPLEPNSDGEALRAVFEGSMLPALEAHRPDILLLSAGFDAHAADPLANLQWTEDDYSWLTQALCDFADSRCGGRVVSSLEGGYDLQALAASAAAHVRALMSPG